VRRVAAATALATVLALGIPAAAHAATAFVFDKAFVYTAAPGEANVIGLGAPGFAPNQFVISDASPATTVKPPCTRQGTLIVCPGDGLTSARFDLGDGNDRIDARKPDATSMQLPIEADGGAGDDVLNGSPLADHLAAGFGRDVIRAGAGDDTVDMQNDERDAGELISCDEGDDTIMLDPQDRIIEYRSGENSYTTQTTCEHVLGQPLAPTPLLVFAQGRKITIDLIDGLPTTIEVEVLAGKKVIARGRAKRKGPRTVLHVKRTAAGRKFAAKHTFFKALARVTVRDTGGRRSVATRALFISRL
jgi:RTX calcium-binding nonapeptide repeat (4 copies)